MIHDNEEIEEDYSDINIIGKLKRDGFTNMEEINIGNNKMNFTAFTRRNP